MEFLEFGRYFRSATLPSRCRPLPSRCSGATWTVWTVWTVFAEDLLRLLAVRRVRRVRRAVRLLRLLAVGYAEPLYVDRRRTAAYDVYVRNVRLVGRSLTNFCFVGGFLAFVRR